MFSHHYFMFPFRFDFIKEAFTDRHSYYKKYDFDQRVRIDDFLKKALEKDGWEYQRFQIKDALDYNELVYFYDFVKDALFNTQDFDKNATSYYFEKKDARDKSFCINILDGKTYDLKIDSITLRLFDTGVGILAFELENEKYSDIEDILLINEFGRRIYPQFLDLKNGVERTKEAFLADSIEVCGIKESFDYKEKEKIRLASYIEKILGEIFSIDSCKSEKYFIQPLLDDRMFVISWYGNDEVSNKIKQDYIESELWYKYVFVDGKNLTVQDIDMQKSLIKNSTYSRWKNYGTLYGITRYSFVVLTDTSDFSKNVILNHVKTMYFQMITLLLANRASILRFSDEITAISDIEPSNKGLSEKISSLYKNYLRYKNKLYFKEITSQEQGIELYDKAREIMRVDSDIRDLSEEIGSLNSYAYLLDEKDEKEQMNKLTKLGTIFLPGTFIAGIFGMNVFPEHFIDNLGGWIISFGGMIALTWWLSYIHDINIKEFFIKKDKKDE